MINLVVFDASIECAFFWLNREKRVGMAAAANQAKCHHTQFTTQILLFILLSSFFWKTGIRFKYFHDAISSFPKSWKLRAVCKPTGYCMRSFVSFLNCTSVTQIIFFYAKYTHKSEWIFQCVKCLLHASHFVPGYISFSTAYLLMHLAWHFWKIYERKKWWSDRARENRFDFKWMNDDVRPRS